MKLVSLRKSSRALGSALFAASVLAIPGLSWAQNSIYSIPASSVPAPTNGGRMTFRVLNGTGGAYADNQIYWAILGINPTNGQWSYLDATGTLRPISAALNNATGHLTKNNVNYANIYSTVSQATWVSLPNLDSARIFLSVGTPCYITTYDNGFAGPNIDNSSDPNRNIYFDFGEFTLNSSGYHGNTTRVDAFGFPLQMRLINNAGNYDHTVGELESETRDGIFSKYKAEVPAQFTDLATIQAPYRIAAPLHGSFAAGGANANYFASYTTAYTTQDIMGATGPLAQNAAVDAAINRHVYTLPQAQWNVVSNYYQAAPANYYAAFWHRHSIDGLAYGMPYDDVNGQAAYMEVGDPKGLIVRVGWNTPVTGGGGGGGYTGTPYSGTAVVLPGTLNATNYDKGGEGVAYHDTEAANQGGQYRTTEGVDIEATTDPGGNGYNVGWTATGEWMKYSVNVTTSGSYNVTIRTASQGGGGIVHLEDENGNRLTSNITLPNTGAWQTWANTTTTANLTAGNHVYKLVEDAGNFNLKSVQFAAVNNAYTGTPYSGTPAAVPGAIYFVNYDKGGEGVGFHDSEAANQGGQYRTTEGVDIEATTDPGGPGYNVGWTAAGEWMKYTVNVATTKAYTIGFRVAAPATGGTFHLEDENGTRLTGTVSVPATGGYQNWVTVTATANLTAGKHVLKFVEDTGGYNINFMAF